MNVSVPGTNSARRQILSTFLIDTSSSCTADFLNRARTEADIPLNMVAMTHIKDFIYIAITVPLYIVGRDNLCSFIPIVTFYCCVSTDNRGDSTVSSMCLVRKKPVKRQCRCKVKSDTYYTFQYQTNKPT